jgi:hypothetical protein
VRTRAPERCPLRWAGLTALKGGGLLPPPLGVPLFPPPPETYSGECGMAGSFHKVADGGGAGSDFGAASVYVMVNPQTGERTGVLAVRTFVESQVYVIRSGWCGWSKHTIRHP